MKRRTIVWVGVIVIVLSLVALTELIARRTMEQEPGFVQIHAMSRVAARSTDRRQGGFSDARSNRNLL